MWNEIDVLRDVSARLEKAGLDFMLTGSVAMNFYAEPRMTRDIDIVVRLTAESAPLVEKAFSGDYYLSPEAIREAISHDSMFNLIHEESITKVDFIIRKESPYRVAEFERRRRLEVEDFWTWIVSKEDLIISKMEWAKESHSSQQLADIRNLLSSGCDDFYLERCVETLGLTDIWSNVRA